MNEGSSPITTATKSIFAGDVAETERLGESLAKRLVPGSVLLLVGNLGAGKTTFARGLGRGLEIPTPIQSPTFALIYEHRGRLPLAHMDFYRLNAPDDLDELGLEEYLDGNGIVLIEWPDLARNRLPDSWLEIHITPEADGRRFEMSAAGRMADVLNGWNP